jgi:hypothetical protein
LVKTRASARLKKQLLARIRRLMRDVADLVEPTK